MPQGLIQGNGRHEVNPYMEKAMTFKRATAAFAFIILSGCAAPAVEKPEYKRTVLFENEEVMVVEVRFAPGAISPLHTHRYPGRVIYVLSGGVLEFTPEGGKPRSAQVVAGKANWFPKESHTIRNVGDTEVRAVEIEIKNVGPR